MKKIFKRIKPWCVPVAVTLTVLFLFRVMFLFGYVPSESMEPTLKAGTLILGLRIHGDLEKNDIVIFRHEGRNLIKRIAATEGDVIAHNNQLQTVPEGCFYMLGDNTDNSYDSRYWEDPFVKKADIVAKLVLPAV